VTRIFANNPCQCIAELRDKSEQFKQTGYVRILDAEVVVTKSDATISGELQDELRAGVKPLEDVPDHQKDWHPDSDDLVLDLVHPSLFPVVWGVTRALEEGTVPLDGCAAYTSKGAVVAPYVAKPKDPRDWQYLHPPETWGSFQWLPAQVELAADSSAKITSYINNLHPAEHKALYGTLERIVAATVPLWEDTLNGFGDRRRFNLDRTGDHDYIYPPGLKYRIPGREGPRSLVDPVTEEFEDGTQDDFDDGREWRYANEFYQWKRNNRILTYREPREYIPQAELPKHEGKSSRSPVSLRDSFPAGLQVIFKLANIHLTPEDPSYAGGSWHVEGSLNEQICASAIYYYDQDNVTDSHLAFRQCMNAAEIGYTHEQFEYDSLEKYLGVQQEKAAVQDLGQVLTREGRLLVFPNCLQHQVQPFELRDRSRPGHRKILAMFLIDPHRPILSSAHVPPQRRDWWAHEVRKAGVLSALPNEIVDMTLGMVEDFPFSWEQAEEIRERLMEERGGHTDQLEEYVEGVSHLVAGGEFDLTVLYRIRFTFVSIDHSTNTNFGGRSA
jgi:hypothetical protein